jgi:hypothetical protein
MKRALLATCLAITATATAAPTPPALHVDAEVDPTAYALAGNSLHLGVGWDRYRVDLGSFALAVPQWVHGQSGFDVSFAGFGAKLQVFAAEIPRGLFAGVEASYDRVLVQRQGSALADRQRQLGLGVDLGYRIGVTERLYVTPWIGVGYLLGARAVTLADATYQPTSISVFPAVHLGYQFQ